MDFSPKEITIEETPAQTACILNNIWHSKLPVIQWSNVVRNTHYVCYVFQFKEAIIGTAIWSSPIAQNRMRDGKKILELRRLALSNVCPYNTASYVLSKMEKMIRHKFPDIIKFISYQDKEVHHGTIYKASNWHPTGQTELFEWTTPTRKRSELQSRSFKIRWEKKVDARVSTRSR